MNSVRVILRSNSLLISIEQLEWWGIAAKAFSSIWLSSHKNRIETFNGFVRYLFSCLNSWMFQLSSSLIHICPFSTFPGEMLLFCWSEGNKTEHKYCNFFIVRVWMGFLLFLCSPFFYLVGKKWKSQAYFHSAKRFKLFEKPTMHCLYVHFLIWMAVLTLFQFKCYSSCLKRRQKCKKKKYIVFILKTVKWSQWMLILWWNR